MNNSSKKDENRALFTKKDRKKRLIIFKIPTDSDLLCRKIKYQEKMQQELGEEVALESISFYIANLEAQDWLLVDPDCNLPYQDDCYCKVTTLLDASMNFNNKVRQEMLSLHLESIEEIDFHLRSLNASRGNGENLSNLCTECLINPNLHEVKLLDLLWIKFSELNDFNRYYQVEHSVIGAKNEA